MLFFHRRIDRNSSYANPQKLKEIIDGSEPHLLIDVRTPSEYASGHIPTARLIPHRQIVSGVPTTDKDQLIVVYCQSGARSATAKRSLLAAGYSNVVNFGPVSRWPGSLDSGGEGE